MNGFTNVIGKHLDSIAQIDPMFAHVYKTNGKDIPDCCEFVISEVRKTNRIGFSDDEIFGIAKHYFEEADIKPFKGKAPGCEVVTNDSSQEQFKNESTSKPAVKTQTVAPAKPVAIKQPKVKTARELYNEQAREEGFSDNLFAEFGF